MDNSYSGKLYYDSGELRYEGFIQNEMPCGQGISYFKNGRKHMEGRFGGWFIEEGKEYYKNGNLKFEGKYNSGREPITAQDILLKENFIMNQGGYGMRGHLILKNMGAWATRFLKAQNHFFQVLNMTKISRKFIKESDSSFTLRIIMAYIQLTNWMNGFDIITKMKQIAKY